MNQKLVDFNRTMDVIQSCITSAQNNVAYQMAFNFHNKHNDQLFLNKLLDECDRNLVKVCR